MEKYSNISDSECLAQLRSIMPIFPWWLRLAGLLGEQLERFGAFRHVLSVDSILNEAKRKTRLPDFGDDFSLDALQMMTEVQ
jgi:hypothetical protein